MIERWTGQAAADVADAILRSLPEWFGRDNREYVRAAETLPTWVAIENGQPVGFVSVEQPSPLVWEIIVMGILPSWHRRGIGRALVDAAAEHVRANGGWMLHVKTLGPSDPSPEYARTRGFYAAMGFRPAGETALWGEDTPCLLLFKPL